MLPKLCCILIPFLNIATFGKPSLGITADGHLDRKVLRQTYLDGDFDVLKKTLDGYLKNPDSEADREDSIFAFKYLGVMAAADSASKVLGQSYFTQLLRLSPNIQLVGMYEPARVKQLFAEVREDMLKEQQYQSLYDEVGNLKKTDSSPPPSKHQEPASAQPSLASSNPVSAPNKMVGKKPKPKIKSSDSLSSAWIWWTLGVGAAGGLGFYVWNEMQSRPKTNTPLTGIDEPK